MDSDNILFDPDQLQGPIDISGHDGNTLVANLGTMMLIRLAEEKIADNVSRGLIRCPCHLGIGQEAIAVGASRHLASGDRIFGAHRSHAHFLAAGGSVYSLFAEVLGRFDGCSGGMGGSMHLYDESCGFLGAVPIVAGSIPIAVGAALAAKLDGGESVAVSYFGDGAAEEGVFHESLNLASSMRLPVVFVCENNLFASHMHIGLRQPGYLVSRHAYAHGMPGEAVDGNDLVAVSESISRAFERARRGDGPSLVEAVTYRWRGHVGPSEDIDVGIKRSRDLTKWKQRDPIARLARALSGAGTLSGEGFDELRTEIQRAIDDAWERALKADFPEADSLTRLVYFSGTDGCRLD